MAINQILEEHPLKYRIYLLLMGGLLSLTTVSAETINVDSAIKEAIVYPDQATIVRTGEVALKAGSHHLRIASLPGTIQPNSVSAKGKSDQRVKLFGAQLEIRQLELPQDERVRSLEEQIRSLETDKKSHVDAKQILSGERKYLGSIQAASADQIGKDLVTRQPSADDAAAILQFMDTALTENYRRDREADGRIQEIDRKINQLKRELGQLNRARRKSETAIVVDVEADAAATFNFEVSYRLAYAGWSPSYEARVNSGQKEVIFTTYGVVTQNTGEEWKNIKLTLSTARPSTGGRMPELQSWHLKHQPPMQPMAMNRRKESVDKLKAPAGERMMVMSDMAYAPQLNEAEEVYAQLSSDGPTVSYELPRPVSIPSNNEVHKFPVAGEVLPADFAYETTPKLISQVFFERIRRSIDDAETIVLNFSQSLAKTLIDIKNHQATARTHLV